MQCGSRVGTNSSCRVVASRVGTCCTGGRYVAGWGLTAPAGFR